MAASIIVRKCQQCAGRLEYIKEKKIYRCLYCGAESEREEQYDGLFTIKNVVRQVLLDVAYRRLDNAEKNLIECEKIDSKYIGTIIAKIAFKMVTTVTPGACSQTEHRNLLLQIIRDYDALKAIDTSISADEEALYEFLDSADIYATLLLVYDSLSDTTRRDYVAEMLSTSEVYANEPNKNLLSYGLKNSKFELIEKLMNNSNNIDPIFALSELLQKYPDNECKVTIIEKLLKSKTIKQEDKSILEDYMQNSVDSLSTKGKIITFAYAANLHISVEKTILHLLLKANSETVDSVLRQLCSSHLKDDDVYKVLELALSAKTLSMMLTILTILKETKQYILINSKYIISLLSRTDLNTSDKIEALTRILEFPVDVNAKNAAINNYLCFNQDIGETRLAVIQALLSDGKVIPTNTIEQYVLKINTDAVNKPKIVEQLFSLDLNLSFFNDLLAKYINSYVDTKEIKEKIVHILVSKGLKIDPKSILDFICDTTSPSSDKVFLLQNMLLNGAQLRGDTVNTYLATITPDQFSSELFALISNSASDIKEKTLANYLLICKDRDSQKVKFFIMLAKQSHKKVSEAFCDVVLSGKRISGNLLAIYLLGTPDSFEISKEIADYMISCNAKVNSDIQVGGIGVIKIKKFVTENRKILSPVTTQLCSAYKLC